MKRGTAYKVLPFFTCVLAGALCTGCGQPVAMTDSGSADQAASSSDKTKASELDLTSYEAQREVILAQELESEHLTDDEMRVDEKLKTMKAEAAALYGEGVAYGINDWSSSATAETRLHEFCVSLPKGANLQVHDISGLSVDALIDLLAGRENVLVCLDEEGDFGKLYLEGSSDVPESAMPLRDALGIREEAEGEDEDVDNEGESEASEEAPLLSKEALRDLLTLGTGQSPQSSWAAYDIVRGKLTNLMEDASLVTALYEAGFREQLQNGVELVELRLPFGEDDQQNASLLTAVRDAYYAAKRDHPTFVVRVIACASKDAGQSKEAACNALRSAIRLVAQTQDESEPSQPRDFVVGLDLLGNEDSSRPLKEYADFLGSDEVRKSGLKLNLHCGQSLQTQNACVVDAYLLGASRIGHGINLYRYPALMESYAKDYVAIEVSPMSDYRLDYVGDLRLHPASLYLRSGNQVVLCSDVGTLVEPSVLVDDFYAATLCWDLSLADLKALCRNSIFYSSLPEKDKSTLMAVWEEQWDAFIKEQLSTEK